MAQKKILVVDDEQDCRTFLQSILENEGYQVITASDGHEAVEKADAEFHDLVILDVMMETYTAGSNVSMASGSPSPMAFKIMVTLFRRTPNQ